MIGIIFIYAGGPVPVYDFGSSYADFAKAYRLIADGYKCDDVEEDCSGYSQSDGDDDSGYSQSDSQLFSISLPISPDGDLPIEQTNHFYFIFFD